MFRNAVRRAAAPIAFRAAPTTVLPRATGAVLESERVADSCVGLRGITK